MNKLKFFIHLLLLLTTPTLLIYPQEEPISLHNQQDISSTLTYDEIVNLLHEIESGELENRCSFEEFEKIKHFLAFLAKEGALSDSLFLEEDIDELLEENWEVIPCKTWVHKQCKHTRKFIKKHKKEILIGAAVVVAVAVVVVAVAAVSTTAASAAVASAGAMASSDSEKKGSSSSPKTETPIAPTLKAEIDNQIEIVKENIVREQFFQPTLNSNEMLSLEENGRAIGSIIAHETFSLIEHKLPYQPGLSQEIQEIKITYPFFASQGDRGHLEIDQRFSTNYTHFFSPNNTVNFNTLYHARAENALDHGYHEQAILDFGKVIAANPTNPLPYLERGAAYFSLKDYDRSLEDYHNFVSQTKTTQPLSIPDFSYGFAKGLPKGIYDSGSGLFLFASDLIQHPINTGAQMWDALTLLSNLAKTEQWDTLSEALAPEVHQLVKEWDSLPSDKKGELTGYAFGKYGADILLPGAIAKAVSKGLKGGQELAIIYKSLQTAEQSLVLESAANIGNGAKIAEVIEASQKTIALGDELGFSTTEMAHLKQAGQLEGTISHAFENVAHNPTLQDSFQLFGRAQNFLKSYKGFMPEEQCRELIHQAGIQTFPRPIGVPENFRTKLSGKGAGMKYVHPENEETYIRIMPGKPHSPFPYQQKPYVIQMKDGKAFDKYGNIVLQNAPEAHIPFEEFIYRFSS